MSSSQQFFRDQIESIGYDNSSLSSLSLPTYSNDPLSSLDTLSCQPIQNNRVKKKKKKNRMSSIEQRFGMTSNKKKKGTRSMNQLMLDLTPKWQRPAVKDHYRAGRDEKTNKDRDRDRDTDRDTDRNRNRNRNNKLKTKGVRRPRQQNKSRNMEHKQAKEQTQRLQQRTRNVEAKVAKKYTTLKPNWRSVAAFEDDDGSTKSAIASLLHSGFRLQVPGGEEKMDDGNIATYNNDRNHHQNDTNSSSWKPQFISVSAGEKARKAAAVAKIRNMVGGSNSGDNDVVPEDDVINPRNQEKTRNKRQLQQRKNRSGRRSNTTSQKRSNFTNKTKKRNYDPYTSSTTNLRTQQQRRSRSTQPNKSTKRPAWGGSSSSLKSKSSTRKRRVGLNRSASNSSTISNNNSNSSNSNSHTTVRGRQRHDTATRRNAGRNQKRSTSQPPKQQRGKRGMRNSHSTSSLSSSSSRRKRVQRNGPKADKFSTPVLSKSTHLRRGGRSSHRTSSTFVTSLASSNEIENESPMRGRMRVGRSNGKVRSKVPHGSLNTSRGLGGHDTELHGVRARTKKRTVKTAPIATMSSLRLSPDSKRKKMAWMGKPVLNNRRSNHNNKNRKKNDRHSIQATVRTQKSRNQLSKMTSKSQRQRQQRHTRQNRQNRNQSIDEDNDSEPEQQEREEEEEISMSSTFLTGSIAMNSPPIKKKRDSKKTWQAPNLPRRNVFDDENENEMNNSTASSTFLTSSNFETSPNSPRVSKLVHSKRFITKGDRVVKRSLGKSLW